MFFRNSGESSPPVAAVLANAFDDVFAFGDFKVVGNGDMGDLHILEAPRLVTLYARQMDVATMAHRTLMVLVRAAFFVLAVAHAVFLHTAAIVDGVEQTLFGKEGEGAEEGRLVDGVERVLHIGEAERGAALGCIGIGAWVQLAEGAPHKEAHSGDADAGMEKFVFVVHDGRGANRANRANRAYKPYVAYGVTGFWSFVGAKLRRFFGKTMTFMIFCVFSLVYWRDCSIFAI